MSHNKAVRASREGDQFHYLWTARRCLQLLSPLASVVAITIEGASPLESTSGKPVKAGEEQIDTAEYHGSEDVAAATLVRYCQLKHSTVRQAEPWTVSGLRKTLEGFSKRYTALRQRLGPETLSSKLEFYFVSNRPIQSDLLEAVHDAAQGLSPRHPTCLKRLQACTHLREAELADFCQLLRLEGQQPSSWEQRNILYREVGGYLPNLDGDAPVLLKELVTRKALPESARNPTITKFDVLHALHTDEDSLFPAPCLITDLEGAVPREQERELINYIVQSANAPVVIHAEGGVGKSVFSTRIGKGLPEGSCSVLYDCFGAGQYRSPSGYRHRHKDALVQIANELASKGLCLPLIPAPYADSSAYMKAFLGRLNQSVTSLRASSGEMLLCLIIDAADNAQMAAREANEAKSFILDLLRERLPDGIRLVTLCRTHRQELLDPPPSTLRLTLQPFSHAETAAHLRQSFPAATDLDVAEFHRLTSQNPRVQALALSEKTSLGEMLRKLGPSPTTVDDTIKTLLDTAIAELRDKASSVEKEQMDRICMGLAMLRPLIPMSVLASLSGVAESAIKSFAFDLGSPLMVAGDTIQFRDEPTETWFREQFNPKPKDVTAFLESLEPLASASTYVASVLPQLLLEAGRLSELITLALSSQGLPDNNPMNRRDIELQRLQFALQASLRAGRHKDAAKLALRAGWESAGNQRQRRLLRENTDLISALTEPDRIQEIVSRRELGSVWMGSRHAYEAGLLSGHEELLGDARSRLRMAHEWLHHWSQLSDEDKEGEEITDQDKAEMAMAHLNLHGPESCAGHLRGWTPREISFQAGRILARKLVDHGRYQELHDLATAATNNVCLVLAIALELRQAHQSLSKAVVTRALRLLLHRRNQPEHRALRDSEETVLQAVIALVESGYKLSACNTEALVNVLTCYLPPSPFSVLSSELIEARFTILRAYVLRAALLNQSLDVIDLATPEVRRELENKRLDLVSSQAREFRQTLGALLPWHRLWANVFLGRVSGNDITTALAEAKSASASAASGSYWGESHTANERAWLWLDILLEAGSVDQPTIDSFDKWVVSVKPSLNVPTLIRLARVSARTTPLQSRSLVYAGMAFDRTNAFREDAEAKASTYVFLARAVLTVQPREANAYFDQAIVVTSKIGEENHDRWAALLDLADRAADPQQPAPEIAYKLARCAEVTSAYYVNDKHFRREETIVAIAGLCPSSSLAILSRWRDRNHGSAKDLLPVLVTFLMERGKLSPKTALALVGFRARWDEVQLLRSTLQACATRAEKETAVSLLYRYMTLEGQSALTWRALKDTAASHGLVLPDIDERIAFSEREEGLNKPGSSGYSFDIEGRFKQERKYDWEAIFVGVNFSDANDVSRAYQRFKQIDRFCSDRLFLQQACERVSFGKEAEFVEAFADVTDFELSHLGSFLEQIPSGWKKQLSVKAALADTMKTFCRRHYMEVTTGRHYQALPLEKACELSGVAEGVLVDVVLSAVGEATELLSAHRLFTLVGLLATKLTPTEAREALSYGLDLFDSILEDEDGDGPWSVRLAPPADVDEAIAGYVWAGLAAPQASVRWEAAHVVRALCTLGRDRPISHLLTLAREGTGGPFADARLHFYGLHARQWLLIALARAALDTPTTLVTHVNFLTQIALNEEHVLIRGFAAKAALALIYSGHSIPQPGLQKQLEEVNTSRLPAVEPSHDHHRVVGKIKVKIIGAGIGAMRVGRLLVVIYVSPGTLVLLPLLWI